MLFTLLSFIIAALLLFLTHLGINALHRRFTTKGTDASKWSSKNALLRILHGPFKYLLWAAVLVAFSYTYLKNFIHLPLVPLERLEQALLVVFLAWSFSIGMDELQKYLRKIKGKDETTVLLVGRIGIVTVAISTILLLLPLLGINISGLLAFGGLSGVILGFGVKDFLANIFGGFLLAFDQPFHIGDWIYTLDGKIDGHIEEVGWRLTRLRLLDKRVLYIPNSSFLNTLFVNASQMTHRRIVQLIPIPGQDSGKLQAVLQELRDLIKTVDHIDPKQSNSVHLVHLGPTGLEINITVFSKVTKDPQHKILQEEFLFKVYTILKENDIKIGQPVQPICIEKPIDYRIMEQLK